MCVGKISCKKCQDNSAIFSCIPKEKIKQRTEKIKETKSIAFKKRFQDRNAEIARRLGVNDLKEYLVSEYKTKSIREISSAIGVPSKSLTNWFKLLSIPIRCDKDEMILLGKKNKNAILLPENKEKARLAVIYYFSKMQPSERSAWARRAGVASYQSQNSRQRETNLESELYGLLHENDIPFKKQHPITNKEGRTMFFADALVGKTIVVEAYGRFWHSGRFEKRDKFREDFIRMLGYELVIIWGENSLENKEDALELIKSLYSTEKENA